MQNFSSTPLRKEEPRGAQAYMEEYYNLSLGTGRESISSIQLVQDKIHWRAVVDTIMNFEGS